MGRPSQFTPQTRAGPAFTGQAGAERESRERIRETAYRPDGSVAGVREREFWQVWRQPVAALPPDCRGLKAFGLWDGIVEFILLFAGIHLLLVVAIAGGALARWVGWNPIAGYAVTWFILYWLGIRPRL